MSFIFNSVNDQANKIRRLTLTTDITLTPVDEGVQNLINTTGGNISIGLPFSPYISLRFEVINHDSSTNNIIFAGETIIPGERHAVQYDGVEWVIL